MEMLLATSDQITLWRVNMTVRKTCSGSGEIIEARSGKKVAEVDFCERSCTLLDAQSNNIICTITTHQNSFTKHYEVSHAGFDGLVKKKWMSSKLELYQGQKPSGKPLMKGKADLLDSTGVTAGTCCLLLVHCLCDLP
eukprot:TRINITY_DN46326_c0_g1_i2.p1 TRINITY_DN46326_c0_g1~~TRINITY_DN46326_c0_g1_i2.p1  ORF type:complete len:138 (+),score=4.67 TRINITY_DN46326_c0_g1_i2:22-435(+)